MPSQLVITSWRTDKHPDAKQLRDSAARELRKEGWTVECYKADFIGRGGFSVYGFHGFRPSKAN